jgi:hypothetical protein
VSVEFGIITSVVPPGGWHYVQKLASGQTHKVIGFSFEQLIDNILDFRRRHLDLCGAENAYIEAVRADLKAYYCANFRQNCADSSPAPHKVQGLGFIRRDYSAPIDRAGNWLGQFASFKPEFVDTGLAGHRAQICAQCSLNIRWQTPCAPCNETIEVRLQNFLGNLRTPLDHQLHMCRSYGHINRAAVWLSDTQSHPLHPPPAHCWKQQNGQ